MKRVIRQITYLLLKSMLVVFLSFGLYHFGIYAYDFGRQIYSEEGMTAAPGKDVAVVISEGESIKETAQMLERFGLIRNAMVFMVQERLSRYHGQIQPGNYVLNTSQSGNEMIAILSGQKETTANEET